MKKKFDCIEMKRNIQEQLWIEAGESLEGLKKLLKEKAKNDKLWIELKNRKSNMQTI